MTWYYCRKHEIILQGTETIHELIELKCGCLLSKVEADKVLLHRKTRWFITDWTPLIRTEKNKIIKWKLGKKKVKV